MGEPDRNDRKDRERGYFRALGSDGLASSLRKPFSGPESGRLLSEIGAVVTLLPEPPGRLIDYGCGTGWTSHFLAQRGYDVLGVDLSPEAVAAAQETYSLPNLRFEAHDFDTQVSVPPYFDVALFFDSLHHADDERIPLLSAFNVLRPGGVLIACEPGVGHAKAPTSVEAVRLYGVNERDMPPRVVVSAAMEVGFVSPEVYPHPHVLHGMYGATRSRRFAGREQNALGMLARALYAVVYRRGWGIVRMRKPG